MCCSRRDGLAESSDTAADAHQGMSKVVHGRPRVSREDCSCPRIAETFTDLCTVLTLKELVRVSPCRVGWLVPLFRYLRSSGSRLHEGPIQIVSKNYSLASSQANPGAIKSAVPPVDWYHFRNISDIVTHMKTAGDEMSLQQQELNSVIPDLRDLSLEQLAELGDSALAHSIKLYRQRLKETGVPLSSFNARI